MMDLDLHTTGVRCMFHFFSFPCIVFLFFVTSVLICRVHYSLRNNLSCNIFADGRCWGEAEGFCHSHFCTCLLTPTARSFSMLILSCLFQLQAVFFKMSSLSSSQGKAGCSFSPAFLSSKDTINGIPWDTLGLPQDAILPVQTTYLAFVFLFPLLGLHGIPRKYSFLNYSIYIKLHCSENWHQWQRPFLGGNYKTHRSWDTPVQRTHFSCSIPFAPSHGDKWCTAPSSGSVGS